MGFRLQIWFFLHLVHFSNFRGVELERKMISGEQDGVVDSGSWFKEAYFVYIHSVFDMNTFIALLYAFLARSTYAREYQL